MGRISNTDFQSAVAPALIVAAEASGDCYGAALAAALPHHLPVHWFGVGGDQMAAAGVELVTHARELSVLGLIEILRHLPRIFAIERRLDAEVDRRRPRLAVLIDSPGINLRLSARLHRRGVPVIYFVAPQLWAWRPWRVRFLRRYVRKLLCIFPFEEEWFRRRGVAVECVGHPLVEAARPTLAREEFLQRHSLRADRPTIALLPGSRNQEVERHLPTMLEAAAELARRRPLQCALVKASTADPGLLQGILHRQPELRVAVVEDSPYNALAAADLAVISSGTATVEAMLVGTPMVVVYRVAPASWWLGKLLVRTPHYSMVNLMAGERLVPELIQSSFTPARLAAEISRLLDDAAARRRIQSELARVKEQLGPPGAIERACRAIVAALGADASR